MDRRREWSRRRLRATCRGIYKILWSFYRWCYHERRFSGHGYDGWRV